MDCKDIKKIIPLLAGDEFSKDGNPEFMEHVNKCKECKEELRLFEKTWNLLDSADKITPSTAFKSKVRQKISEAQKTPLFRFPEVLPKWAPAFVMALLLLTGGGMYLENISTGRKIQDFALMTEYEDTAMFEDLDMVEEFELIELVNLFEEADVIESIEL